MKNIYVYILECSDGSYYTGVTNNLERRLYEHNCGLDKNCYTFDKRPVKCIFTELYPEPLYAIRREKQIKGWSRRKKQALINGHYEQLPELSKSNK